MKHLIRYCGWLAGCGLLTMGALAGTISVTNTNDTGPGSLRDAIDFANTNGPSTTILFAITPFDSAVKTITPLSALPTITNSVNIDGYTQSNSSPNTLASGDNAVLLIELDGANAGFSSGLDINSGSNTVRGLVINGFSFYGIDIRGSGNLIEGNFIGTDPTGTAGLGNGFQGIAIFSACCNKIGGTSPGARNLISGNTRDGVLVFGGDSSNTVVQGNFIGTDVSGADSLGNSGDGVAVRGAADCLTGGLVAGGRNVISANTGNGISISGVEGPGGDGTFVQGNFIGTDVTGTNAMGNAGSGVTVNGYDVVICGNIISDHGVDGISISSGISGCLIQGNFIGTDVTGTKALGNTFNGISVNGFSNTIGGTSPGAGNVISDNGLDGVDFFGDNNNVQGNLIGTDATGTNVLGNAGDGVFVGANNNTIGGAAAGVLNVISGNANGIDIGAQNINADLNVVQGNRIGTDVTGNQLLSNSLSGVFIYGVPGDGSGEALNNTVGGIAPGDGNLIAGNGSNGVTIVGFNATGNAILGNAIFSNTGLGIDLEGDGVTTNDACDPDTGPNDLQNFPVLVSAFAGVNSVTITGSLNSVSNTVYHVEFFVNTACNPSGYGEGEFFLGNTNVTTDVNCQAPFQVTFPVSVSANEVITATATDPFQNTSEFSPCVSIQSSCTLTCPGNISATNDPGQCGAVVNFSAQSFATSCGAVTCTPSSGSFFPVGTTSVTCTNGNGLGCGFSVQINDAEKPAITCPPTRTVNVDPGQCSASSVILGAPVVSGACGATTVANNAPASFPVGTNTVTWTVRDVHGNTSSCQQSVIVIDNQPPTITCPPTKTVNADPGQCSASSVSLGTPVVLVNCGVPAITNNAPASFPKGTNTVTWTVTDVHGNTNSCEQLVVVLDLQPPTFGSFSNITKVGVLGAISNAVTFANPRATDNCSTNVTVVSSPHSGSFFPFGTNTVNVTATDPSGNTASTNFLVIVLVPIGPDLTGAPLTTPPTDSDTNGWVAGIGGTFPLPNGGTRRLILGAFDVLNAGSNAASAFVVQFYLADQSNTVLTLSNQLPFATANVSSLASSKIRHLVFAVFPPSTNSVSGKYLIAYIDAQHQVPESNEQNNIFYFQLGPEITGSASVRQFHKLVRDHRTQARRAARAGGP
jgi:hypothetical protein